MLRSNVSQIKQPAGGRIRFCSQVMHLSSSNFKKGSKGKNYHEDKTLKEIEL